MKEKMILIIIITAALTACAPHFHLDFMGKDRIQEVVLTESKTKTNNKILVIDLNGAITNQTGGGILDREGDPVSKIYYRLKKASEDPTVKGIILRLDTPGGDVTTSDIIYKEVLRFKEKTGLPVVALMMGVAASGGYYVASACDTIMAHPTTITGSIGVIGILPGFKKVLDKVGIDMTIIKSGKMKDAGSPFKEIGDDEKAYFQEMIDAFYNTFLQVVHENRKELLSMEDIRKLADGRVYHAKQALELKLIDAIGYFDEALEKVKEMASIREAKVIAYTYHPSRKTNIYASAAPRGNPFSVEIKAFDHLLPNLETGFYYLWLPETGR